MSKMKTKIFFTKLGYAFVGLASIFVLQISTAQASLKSAVAKQVPSSVKATIAVYDLKDKKQVFDYNGTLALNPASTQKILTSVVALKELGGSYHYKTPVSTDQFSNGIIQNLYLKGVGDPSLVEERLWRMAKDLKVRGVKQIKGDIIIDQNLFDDFDFQGKINGSTRAYNASVSPFALNFNSFAVVATNMSSGLEVHVDPPIDYFVLRSKIGRSGNSIAISRSAKGGKEYVVASGGVSRSKIKYANVLNPSAYAGQTLAWMLRQMDIDFKGQVKQGKASGGKTLFVDQSKPLSHILNGLNKFSNNFTAEMILKTLGAKRTQKGNTESGVQVLKSYLKEWGIPSSQVQVYNGSGLSRKNRISATALNKILAEAYQDHRVRSDLMASLAVGGVDGTLKSRMKQKELQGNVKAKTGTLHDVAALSGYMEAASGKPYAFTILLNGAVGGRAAYRIQEALLLELYQSY